MTGIKVKHKATKVRKNSYMGKVCGGTTRTLNKAI